MKILCLGDTHIPERAAEIPEWIMKLLVEERPDRILFTGDATDPSVIYLLERVAPVYAVRGNMDRFELPREISLELDGIKLLLMHGDRFGRGGYQEMARYAKQKGHDFVVCGHTHRQETFKTEGVVVVNPGSATGAWGGGRAGAPATPSVSIINTENREVVLYSGGIENGIQSKRFQG